jgi:hypothetical protein
MLKLRRYPHAVCVPASGASISRPVEAESLDRMGCGADDLEAVSVTLEWARTFLGVPHADLGRRGPVCPYIQHSFDERLLYVSCRPEAECTSDELITAVRTSMQRFTELQQMAPTSKKHLVSVLIVLPRIDRDSSDELNALQRELKDEFVSNGLMIGQFHPKCEARGLWSGEFRPLQSPIPLLAIREMVPSDLPFLVESTLHASKYFERYARSIPAHTRRYLVERLVEQSPTRPC